MPPKEADAASLHVTVVETATSSSSSFDQLRVFAHPSTLRALRLQASSPVAIILSSETAADACILADVWPRSTVAVQEVCIPSALAPMQSPKAWRAKLVGLQGAGGETTMPYAVKVALSVEGQGEVDEEKASILSALAKEHLLQARYITPGNTFCVNLQAHEVRLSVKSASKLESARAWTIPDDVPSPLHAALALTSRASRSMEVTISKPDKRATEAQTSQVNGVLQKESAYATLGGLDAQIEELRKLVELPLRRPDVFKKYGLRAPRGLLLFGPPGTGKTTLAYSAARSCVAASSIETISGPELTSSLHGGTERALRRVFNRARKNAPSVVIIDEIDALAPRRDGDAEGAGEVEKRVVATLLTLMDGLGNETDEARVVVIAATNRPNAIDTALRRPGRLDREIEVGIPDSRARLAILDVLLRNVPHNLSRHQVEDIALRTHGYVGADLSALVREAGMRALARDTSSLSIDLSRQLNDLTLSGDGGVNGLTAEDFAIAQAKVRPSAMREISLELPKVAWDDIAPGQSGLEVQSKIRECVEWPLKYRASMERLGIEAPRGVLLYGPPGCSKTLIARALASESGLNFVAVKGPELLNKYVGESERALREVFRKARAASPSIVFFDEIDGLTTSRGAEGGASDRLITTLLNEMDGVEQLSNVLVIAATNRPDVLDSALLRPGRLDRLLYVGPPDLVARRQILAIRTRKMAIADDVDLDMLADLTHGCSGAEIVSICQDAGLRAMNEDIGTKAICHAHLEAAARQIRRRITPAMLRKYEAWRDQIAF